MSGMELERRRVRCLACDVSYPAACGVCPSCGAPMLQAALESPYAVIVPGIPSTQQRVALAERLVELLDCSDDAGRLAEQLSDGEAIVCAELSREAAQVLVESLKKMHVSARMEVARAKGRRAPVWQWIPGWIPLIAGAVIDITTGNLPYFTLGGGALSGATIGLRAAATRPMRGPLCMAPSSPSAQLPGWESAAGALSRLLRTLAGAPREALSRIATDIAFLQEEFATGSLAAYAAGGVGGPFDLAVRALLAGAIGRARLLADGTGSAAEHTAALVALAESSGKARAAFLTLGQQAAGDATPALAGGGDVKLLTASIERELNEAAESLAALDRM